MQKKYDFGYIGQEVQEQEELWKNPQKKLLYVTDEAETYQILKAQGCYVVPYLHEKNRGESFPQAKYAIEDLEEVDLPSMERIYRRLAGLPWTICETRRCRIRETVESDLDSFYAIYQAAAVARYMEKLSPEREKAIANIRAYRENIYSFYGYGIWTVLEKKSGEIIGRAGLGVREGAAEPELGYVIGALWQRQGYACEVCRAVLEVAHKELELTAVQALVQPDNTASAGLCRKLGLNLVGEERLEDGRIYDRYLIKFDK